ncbi:hypothetical protein [Fundidesulfovibrio terrae]|uniref:hypothetical protein n=1 Tax=Fundidesulfovibrio terrae TaxID=2922866 RepID=UPI001FAF113B|nr:hypothetical protein [Fundidesulfovibrio terrae]
MSDINIATVVAQLPNLQGVAGAQLAHPEAQQVFAAQMAQQALKDQGHQVQKVEKEEGSEAVKDEKEKRRGAEQEPHPRKRQAQQAAPEEPESPAQPGSPWLGHLINKQV